METAAPVLRPVQAASPGLALIARWKAIELSYRRTLPQLESGQPSIQGPRLLEGIGFQVIEMVN